VPGRNVLYSYLLPWHERYIEAVSLVPCQRNFSVLAGDFVNAFLADADPLDLFRKYIRQAPARHPLSRILYLDTKTYLPGDILTKVDRMSMAVSLEARVPMLDHVFLEWVTSLTPEWKMGKRGQKYILARLAERVGVPRKALSRPKQGFALPLLHWIRHELKDLTLSLLLEPKTLHRGYFNEKGVRFLLNEFFRGRTDDYLVIWRLMMFELWQRSFLEKFRTGDSKEPPGYEANLRHAIG
jgi:asparagine synthase (glutamine-hydrolysing)